MSRIERDAVTYFINLFDATKRLEPNIPIGDKGNITDGYIDVFNNEYNNQTDHTLKDGNFLGRLHIQVKGKSIKKKEKKLASFELHRNDLENIKKVGGVVLLVASIPKNDEDPKTPYYADLAPSNVDSFIKQMSENQSVKSVPLKELPTEPQAVYNYIRHFQRRQSEKNVISPDTLIMQNATGFEVSLPHDIDTSEPQFFGGPGSIAIIAAKMQDGKSRVIDGILQITPSDYILNEIDELEIGCGNVVFNKTRKRRTLDGKIEAHVSPGIKMVFNEDDKDYFFMFRNQSNLYYILKDLRFIKSLSQGKWVTFNGENALRFTPQEDNVKKYLEPLSFLSELEKLCEEFGIDPRLFRIMDLPDTVLQDLERICNCLFHGELFENNQGIPVRQVLKIGNSNLQLVWFFNEEKEKWLPFSLFNSSEIKYAAVSNNQNEDNRFPERVTPYEFFANDELGTVLNLNSEMLVEAYQQIPGDRGKALAHSTVLKLITSADSTPNRRQELLAMASKLNDWLLELEPSCISHEINNYQIEKRKGELSSSNLERIKEIWQNAEQKNYGSTSLDAEIATSILLGRCDGIDYLLNKMNEDDRNLFKSLPIFYLHENRDQPYYLGEPNNDDEWAEVEKTLRKSSTETLFGSQKEKQLQ